MQLINPSTIVRVCIFQGGDQIAVTLFYHGRFDDSLTKKTLYGLYRLRQTDADYYAYDYGESYSYLGEEEEEDRYFYMTHVSDRFIMTVRYSLGK